MDTGRFAGCGGCSQLNKNPAGETGKTDLGAEPAGDARGGVMAHRGGPGSRGWPTGGGASRRIGVGPGPGEDVEEPGPGPQPGQDEGGEEPGPGPGLGCPRISLRSETMRKGSEYERCEIAKKRVCFACFASKRNGIFCIRNEKIQSEKYRK